MSIATILSRPNLILLGRLALFLGTVVILGWFSLVDVGRRFFVDPITSSGLAVSHFIINLFGGDAVREGAVLVGPRMLLEVKDECNGAEAIVLYTAAVVAHQARLVWKGIGLLLGVVAIWAVNSVRIVTLYAVAAVAPERLEFFHIYFWQTLIIIFVVALWYAWAAWTMRLASSPDNRGG